MKPIAHRFRWTGRPVRYAATTLCLCTALAGCWDSASDERTSSGRSFVVSAPSEADDATGSAIEDFSIDEDEVYEQTPVSKIPLAGSETQLYILDTNLDSDPMDEQIIVTKGRDTDSARIQILVVDYDMVRNMYFLTWQGTTGAVDTRSFHLSLEDMIGDHNIEIVFTGVDAEDRQTLDIFRKTQTPSGFGLYYIPICPLAVDGTIEIVKTDRPQAYELDQKSGQSYPVVTYSRDTSSENPLDIVKSTYYWKYQDNLYVLGSLEKIPGKNIQEKQLQELFQADSAGVFESFLAGPWHLASQEKRDSLSPGDIINFEPDSRKITFYADNIQEIYDWKSSRKNIFRGLSISCTNEAITSIQRQISVAVQSLDTITISVTGIEQWDGLYRKLSSDVRRNLAEAPGSPVRLSEIPLSGLYRNESGFEIYFSSPTLTIQENGRKFSGGYALYSVGAADVLEIRILKENGLLQEKRSYVIEYAEETDDLRTVRSIELMPAVVSVTGVEVLGKGSLKLEQIEIKEKAGPAVPAGS